ncbi:YopX family protein [Clostridium tetani]|uniref:YopX protein domain-containing protein n=1 Tax=Clostridium tetani TaxID=1513 RepID=A0ABY0EQ15_CLOTA|nr:YopX family protein [Clostridium tetani]RXI56953.1 hypothetical protein DP131_06545 [Clostridium tetani]RXI67006.1 hypothetical protein DQN76_12740 [Clostridium tetani]
MNREIKFRGYAVEEMLNSQWIEDAFGVEDIEYTNGKISTYLLTPYGDYEVIKKSVGQYTGLKDKNRVEIYEGDIVKFDNNNFEVYQHPSGDWQAGGYSIWENISEDGIENEWEVIGNIYENPELLEVKQ